MELQTRLQSLAETVILSLAETISQSLTETVSQHSSQTTLICQLPRAGSLAALQLSGTSVPYLCRVFSRLMKAYPRQRPTSPPRVATQRLNPSSLRVLQVMKLPRH